MRPHPGDRIAPGQDHAGVEQDGDAERDQRVRRTAGCLRRRAARRARPAWRRCRWPYLSYTAVSAARGRVPAERERQPSGSPRPRPAPGRPSPPGTGSRWPSSPARRAARSSPDPGRCPSSIRNSSGPIRPSASTRSIARGPRRRGPWQPQPGVGRRQHEQQRERVDRAQQQGREAQARATPATSPPVRSTPATGARRGSRGAHQPATTAPDGDQRAAGRRSPSARCRPAAAARRRRLARSPGSSGSSHSATSADQPGRAPPAQRGQPRARAGSCAAGSGRGVQHAGQRRRHQQHHRDLRQPAAQRPSRPGRPPAALPGRSSAPRPARPAGSITVSADARPAGRGRGSRTCRRGIGVAPAVSVTAGTPRREQRALLGARVGDGVAGHLVEPCPASAAALPV